MAMEDTIAADLSNDQLRDVVDVLRQPLSGRKVLLPFGSQAFFAAKLKPHCNDSKDEMVQVKQRDGNLQLMARAEARVLLEEEYKERVKPKKPAPSALKKPNGPSKATCNSSVLPKAATSIKSNASTGPLAFYDIREEIDASGNRIGGEAIDITQQLRQMETIAADSTNASPRDTNRDDQEDSDASPLIEEDSRTPRQLDQDEYEALAARLDELARLEDMAERDTSSNLQSRRMLTGSTWSKGFLNKKSTTKSKSVATVPAEGRVDAKSTPSRDSVAKAQAVAFSDAAPEVKEIPRIGGRSIREEQQVLNNFKKSSGWSKGFLNKEPKDISTANNRRDMVVNEESSIPDAPPLVAYLEARPIPIKSFDERVLSSVVMEHVVTEKQPQEPPAEEPKKLSKFAQRRLEAMQQE